MKKISTGILYMLSAAFFFSLMAVAVKSLKGRIPSQEIVLARSIILFAICGIIIKKRHLPFWGNNKKLLFMRAFFGFFGLSALFYTLTTIPIAESMVIQYTSPIFTAILAPFILKEHNTRKQWTIYLIAFSGILLVVKPGFSLHLLPALIGLGGACFSGLAYNLVRKLRATEHPLNIILYLPAVSIPMSLPSVAMNFTLPSGIEWILLIFIGFLTFIAQLFMTKGLIIEKAAKATNISYITVVFSSIFGFVFWNETTDLLTISGALIILIAIYWIAKMR